MAKQDYSISFKNAYISLEDNSIIEHTKEEEIIHVLSDVIKSLEGKQLNISFKESKDVAFEQE